MFAFLRWGISRILNNERLKVLGSPQRCLNAIGSVDFFKNIVNMGPDCMWADVEVI